MVFFDFMDSIVLVKFLKTLLGIIDDYFDGYYSEEMIESQVSFVLTLFSSFGDV